MPTTAKSAHELGLLRRITQNLASRPAPHGPLTQEFMRSEGFARANNGPQNVVGILRDGSEPYSNLIEIFFARSEKTERGVSFAKYDEKLFDHLTSSYLGRDPKSIVEANVVELESHLAEWASKRIAKRTVFIPCMVSPWPSPTVNIGPVKFIFLENVVGSEFYQHAASNPQLTAVDFDKLLNAMREEDARWLAVVEIDDCDTQRALIIGDLAVDIALVALQLAQPYLGTKNMSRLATRRGPRMKMTLTISGGIYSSGWSNTEPGTSIGDGYLGKIVSDSAPLITAVGNCVGSFTTGKFRLPILEQAWCDAAYWLHQGLAEPMDSIAVTKLETALEVFLRAESAKGSEKRILAALDTFYALKPDDPITPHTQLTARQFAKGFVQDRSRVLHGTLSTLNTRLSSNRVGLENLAITIIRASAMEIEGYTQSPSPSDDTGTFLAWVKARRSSL